MQWSYRQKYTEWGKFESISSKTKNECLIFSLF
jgi:hypothetical protein